jgi:hypothetical protein
MRRCCAACRWFLAYEGLEVEAAWKGAIMNDAGPNTSHRDVDLRLAFFQKLQAVTTKIHATSNLDEIMLDLGMDFCDLFNCDRFTLYAMDAEKDTSSPRSRPA